MRLAIVDRLSPNNDARPDGVAVDMLILHYTGMPTTAEALARLTDPSASVSAHYLIDEDGTVYRLVAEARRAWHAGEASWRGRRDVNGASIGIELHNPGYEHGYRPYPEPQMAALEALAQDIMARHPIPARHVLGHSDVAPHRKRDPGELFDWRRLSEAGVGLWPARPVVKGEMGLVLCPGDSGPPVKDIQRALKEFGYAVSTDGRFDATTASVVAAFQRHFRAERVDSAVDPETAQRLFELVERIG
ncbi:MAG: N-acetylmuramoyl-L-alanine amidase [Alphaproteobacteria bacterium]